MDNLKILTENYLEYCKTQKRLDPKTMKAYRIDLRQFSEWLPSTDVLEITPCILEAYIARLHQEYKPKTVKKSLISTSFFPFAYDHFKEEQREFRQISRYHFMTIHPKRPKNSPKEKSLKPHGLSRLFF